MACTWSCRQEPEPPWCCRPLAGRPLALPADGHRQPEALDTALGLLERDRLHHLAVLQLGCAPPIGRPPYALAHICACLVEPHLDVAAGIQERPLPLLLVSLELALVDAAAGIPGDAAPFLLVRLPLALVDVARVVDGLLGGDGGAL